ncbi:MAG: hypothetical protein WC091_23675 [Sulfuricellaceae bacterium]
MIKKLLMGMLLVGLPCFGHAAANLAMGANHTLTIKSDGSVYAWGDNSSYQLGSYDDRRWHMPPADYVVAHRVLQIGGATAVAAGRAHSLMLDGAGQVWAWGANGSSQLGDGANVSRYTPVPVTGLSGVKTIAAGDSHNLAIKNDGSVWVWGSNAAGQLGDGTQITKKTALQVAGVSNAVAIAAGKSHSVAVTGDGSVWTWGQNIKGQLGLGTKDQKVHTPAQVPGLTGVVAVAAGVAHTIALKADGTVVAWGDNASYQLGNLNNAVSAVPVKVAELNGVTKIAAGDNHNVALKANGTAWVWGENTIGQLGDLTNVNRYAPTIVYGVTGVADIAAGFSQTFLIQNSGAVWAWGNNGADKQVLSAITYMRYAEKITGEALQEGLRVGDDIQLKNVNVAISAITDKNGKLFPTDNYSLNGIDGLITIKSLEVNITNESLNPIAGVAVSLAYSNPNNLNIVDKDGVTVTGYTVDAANGTVTFDSLGNFKTPFSAAYTARITQPLKVDYEYRSKVLTAENTYAAKDSPDYYWDRWFCSREASQMKAGSSCPPLPPTPSITDGTASFFAGAVFDSADSLTLTANVLPTTSDIGQTAGVYIMATYQGQIYALVSKSGYPTYNFDVVRIPDNKLPPFTSQVLGASVNIELMLGKLYLYHGLEIWAGYGASYDDMVNNHKFARIYTVP